MIQIEKIFTNKVVATTVDIFTASKHAHDYLKFDQRVYALQASTKPADLAIGANYGITGITADHAINNTNESIYFEISFDQLTSICPSTLRQLLRTQNVIVSDYLEGGIGIPAANSTYGTNLPTFILQLQIVPKNLIYITGSYQFSDASVDDLNIRTIVIPFWIPATIWRNSYFVDMLLDVEVQQSYLHKISNITPSRLAIFPNYKPRYHRLLMLALLHNEGLLRDIDWSLAAPYGTNSPHMSPVEYLKFVGCKSNQYDTAVKQFIESYEFPRLLYPVTDNVADSAMVFDINEIRKYHWYLNVETMYGMNISSFKPKRLYGHVTEKTVKAFMLGSMPLTVAVPGYYTYLRELGFDVDDCGLDLIADYYTRIEQTVRTVKYIRPASSALTNATLITDTVFLNNLFYQQLQLINN